MQEPYRILPRVDHPKDLRALSLDELRVLAREIRQRIVEVVNANGGHLASNLGVVEITLALHRVFDFPEDRLVWDVSHQTYPHKLVTGRRDRFDTLRQYRGLSGFSSRKESVFDLFDAGHAGTAVSLGLGVACADELLGRKRKTVVVVGDAAVASGMAFEALNHAGYLRRDLLVVLNDNRMSIDVSVGALARYLNKIRTKPLYADLKKELRDFLARIPVVGKRVDDALEHLRETLKHSFVPGLLFQELGFNYYGPVDGHDLAALIRFLEDLKDIEGPVLLHCLTTKGFGYEPAAENPTKYHASKAFLAKPVGAEKEGGAAAGASPANAAGGSHRGPECERDRDAVAAEPRDASKLVSSGRTYTDLFRELIVAAGREDPRIVAVTAAMPGGTGLAEFAKRFPARYFDVGIAEQHGAGFASGLAGGGLRPVFAVYSTFCQRAYDQVVHDICIQESPVVLCLDRAGLVGEDGWTHHGVFDISFLRAIPNCILMAPRDGEEFVRMFRLALAQSKLAVAIRYPKAELPVLPPSRDPVFQVGKAEVLREGEGIALVAYGSMVAEAWRAAEILSESGIETTVVNARFAKPIDVDILAALRGRHPTLVTIEEHALAGGFGSAVLEALADADVRFGRVIRLGVPDAFQTFGAREKLLEDCGLDARSIARRVARAADVRAAAREPARFAALSAEGG